MVWVTAHVEAIGALQAEEALAAAEVFAVGSGRLAKADAEKVVRRWRTAAGASGGRRLTGRKADLGMLAALGVKVRTDGSR